MTKRKKKAKNWKSRIKEAEEAVYTPRDPAARALALHYRGGTHGDAKKERSRRACRGKVDY